MATDNHKVAWVLGSGFSKPLGGPLLNELLAVSRFERLENAPFFDELARRSQVPEDWGRFLGLCRPLLDVFDLEKTAKKLSPWADAEEFIEMLELEAQNDQSQRVGGVLTGRTGSTRAKTGMTMKALALCGRKYIAAVTHEFIAMSDPRTERWQPYRRWAAECIERRDHVITFNYDLVVEKASRNHGGGFERSYSEDEMDLQPKLHKLHGSVDFQLTQPSSLGEKPGIQPVKDPVELILHPSREVAIGVPGPDKMASARGAFRLAWRCALKALRGATAVVFVGYRFPPTDSYAKRQLLDAIAQNENDHILIHIVLGPERNADIQRLESLIRWALRGKRIDLDSPAAPETPGRTYSLRWHPLWAEDFLAVFDRDGLLE
jgi:hypothetical protein